MTSRISTSPPGLLRRFSAMVYDALVLLAILFLATAVALPLNYGEAFASTQFFYPVYLLVVSFLFFGWFWTHGGQTIGMRAWKIMLTSNTCESVNWLQAFIRFSSALLSWLVFGIGFLWILFNRENKAWHDLLSKTFIVWVGSISTHSGQPPE